jgi:hypothetical protein
MASRGPVVGGRGQKRGGFRWYPEGSTLLRHPKQPANSSTVTTAHAHQIIIAAQAYMHHGRRVAQSRQRSDSDSTGIPWQRKERRSQQQSVFLFSRSRSSLPDAQIVAVVESSSDARSFSPTTSNWAAAACQSFFLYSAIKVDILNTAVKLAGKNLGWLSRCRLGSAAEAQQFARLFC